MNIEDVFKKYGKLVEEALGRALPRRVDEDYLRRITGIGELSFDVEAINRALIDPTWNILSRGGKRWRPILALIVYEALGGEPEEIAELAIIPELIHNGTLMVDDVEDKSEYRRGKPCIHRIYGDDVAINAGNTLYYLPVALMLRNPKIDEQQELAIYRAYVEEMFKLSLGQAIDIAWHKEIPLDISEDNYLLMCSLKTGSLARLAVRIACIARRAGVEVEKGMARFANSVAIAFQIQDDILNILGEESRYGKEIGGDISEGKSTLLTIRAMRVLNSQESGRLREILAMHTTDKSLLAEAIGLIEKSGAIEYAKGVARNLVVDAWKEIDSVLNPTEAKENLKVLADFLINRSY